MPTLKTITTTPKVCHHGHDMSKRWYVHFRMMNPNTGKREQVRLSFGLNYIKIKQERIAEANALCKALRDKLADGWSPFENRNASHNNLLDALNSTTSIKWESLRDRTRHTYRVVFMLFCDWLKSEGYNDIRPSEFTKNEAQQYMDYLAIRMKLRGRTWNNRLAFMKIFFNYLVDRDLITKNPFAKIKRHEESKSTRNYAYTEHEQEILNAYMLEHEPNLYRFCRFIYGLYVRPAEAARLQIRDVNFADWTINVFPDVSKTKKYRVSVIPDSFKTMFDEMRLQDYPSDYYIFSKGCKPGPEYNPSFDKLTPKLKRINAKLGVNPLCTMYSWRHAGIIKLYKILNYNIYECMQVTGHTEMSSFQNYLKTLGFSNSSNFRSRMQ